MSIASLMSVHEITVRTRAVTQGASLGNVYGHTPREVLPCRVVQKGAEEQPTRFGRRGYKADYKVYFASDPNLDTDNQLVFEGVELRIEWIRNPHELDRFWVVGCCKDTGRPTEPVV